MAGPKGETVSAGGISWLRAPDATETIPSSIPPCWAISGVQGWVAMGIDLSMLSFQGPAGYKGMVGSIGAAGRPVGAPLPQAWLLWGSTWPCSVLVFLSPPGQGRPQGTAWEPW